MKLEGYKINISQTEKRSCEKDEVRGATDINLNSKNTDKSQKENSINNTVEKTNLQELKITF